MLDPILEMCSHDMNVLTVHMSTSSTKRSLNYCALLSPKKMLLLLNKCLYSMPLSAYILYVILGI